MMFEELKAQVDAGNITRVFGINYDYTKRKVPCDYANEAVSDQSDAC